MIKIKLKGSSHILFKNEFGFKIKNECHLIMDCNSVMQHVGNCKKCKDYFSYDPLEKALVNSYSFKNELIEIVGYILFGILVIKIIDGFSH